MPTRDYASQSPAGGSLPGLPARVSAVRDSCAKRRQPAELRPAAARRRQRSGVSARLPAGRQHSLEPPPPNDHKTSSLWVSSGAASSAMHVGRSKGQAANSTYMWRQQTRVNAAWAIIGGSAGRGMGGWELAWPACKLQAAAAAGGGWAGEQNLGPRSLRPFYRLPWTPSRPAGSRMEARGGREGVGRSRAAPGQAPARWSTPVCARHACKLPMGGNETGLGPAPPHTAGRACGSLPRKGGRRLAAPSPAQQPTPGSCKRAHHASEHRAGRRSGARPTDGAGPPAHSEGPGALPQPQGPADQPCRGAPALSCGPAVRLAWPVGPQRLWAGPGSLPRPARAPRCSPGTALAQRHRRFQNRRQPSTPVPARPAPRPPAAHRLPRPPCPAAGAAAGRAGRSPRHLHVCHDCGAARAGRAAVARGGRPLLARAAGVPHPVSGRAQGARQASDTLLLPPQQHALGRVGTRAHGAALTPRMHLAPAPPPQQAHRRRGADVAGRDGARWGRARRRRRP